MTSRIAFQAALPATALALVLGSAPASAQSAVADGDIAGAVTVSGDGASLSAAKQMHVGSTGFGTLTIGDGGAAGIGTFLYIGRFSGSEGLVTVSGAGSRLSSGNMVHVGSEGRGILTTAPPPTAR